MSGQVKSGLVVRCRLEDREQSSRSCVTELNLFSVQKEERCRFDFLVCSFVQKTTVESHNTFASCHHGECKAKSMNSLPCKLLALRRRRRFPGAPMALGQETGAVLLLPLRQSL